MKGGRYDWVQRERNMVMDILRGVSMRISRLGEDHPRATTPISKPPSMRPRYSYDAQDAHPPTADPFLDVPTGPSTRNALQNYYRNLHVSTFLESQNQNPKTKLTSGAP